MNTKLLLIAGLALAMFGSSGCSLPKLNAQAEEGRTESTSVPEVNIPFEPGYGSPVLSVEPFRTSSTVISFTHGPEGQVPVADRMAAQLKTALSKVANFTLVDSAMAKRYRLQKGQVGPFVLRATLTEFTENAEGAAESTGVSLGGIGAVAGIAGAVANKPGLMWTGAGVAAANPSYENNRAMKKGVVAFDLEIVDPRTGRIVKSFDCAGTFKTETASNGISLFGISNSKAAFAQSAIGQALRVAMNDAARKTYDAMRGAR